ncbi:hypothetical protein EUGRSUZ_F02478 [Eucalyptus grandis]|uniref:Uncharacterized protein n=2 Tax=Eucalyptus grandis TaxID=71139 RepID=A0ACC3KK41_EUCGR|nr:hypothetical protein EUGRSUZ_F02478 [Eucalyptus grandis]
MIQQVHCPLDQIETQLLELADKRPILTQQISSKSIDEQNAAKLPAPGPRQDAHSTPPRHRTQSRSDSDEKTTKRARLELIDRPRTATDDTCGHAGRGNASSRNPRIGA